MSCNLASSVSWDVCVWRWHVDHRCINHQTWWKARSRGTGSSKVPDHNTHVTSNICRLGEAACDAHRSICLSCLAHRPLWQVEHKKLPHPALWDSIVCSLRPHHSVRSVSYSKIIPCGHLLWETISYKHLLTTPLPMVTSCCGPLSLWSVLQVISTPGSC